jgi:hypothetical protein
MPRNEVNYLNHVAQTDIDFPIVEPGVESSRRRGCHPMKGAADPEADTE